MRIGIIGLGNLGKSLLEGLLFSDDVLDINVNVFARTIDKQKAYENEYNVRSYLSFKDIVDKSDVIIVVLKKQVFRDLSPVFSNLDTNKKLIVSLMSGVSLQELGQCFSKSEEIIRLMPNLSINKRNGVIAHTEILNTLLMDIISKLGTCYLVKEDMIEVFTVISASGLGFAAYFIKLYKDIATDYGLSKEAATQITANIFNDASKADNIEELIESVATEGGITETGILSFEKNGMKDIIETGINEAINKAKRNM